MLLRLGAKQYHLVKIYPLLELIKRKLNIIKSILKNKKIKLNVNYLSENQSLVLKLLP